MDKPQVFLDIEYSQIAERAQDYCARGWRFANLCGTALKSDAGSSDSADSPDNSAGLGTKGGVELIYSFSDGLSLENLRVVVDPTQPIASVSGCFPNAFVFENETHDLFAVNFTDISIDFGGAFYTLSVPTPMNPGAQVAPSETADASPPTGDTPAEGEAHHG